MSSFSMTRTITTITSHRWPTTARYPRVMSAATDIDEAVAGLLANADQRYTNGRRRLVKALIDGGRPLTITQIGEIDSSLPQSSAYRNLTILEEVGAVTRVVTNDEFARYELAEHLMGHHHHLICTSCGDVADFSLDHDVESELDAALRAAAAATGFAIDAHRLDLLGTCNDCT